MLEISKHISAIKIIFLFSLAFSCGESSVKRAKTIQGERNGGNTGEKETLEDKSTDNDSKNKLEKINTYLKSEIDTSRFVETSTFGGECEKKTFAKMYSWKNEFMDLFNNEINSFVDKFSKLKDQLEGIYLVDFDPDVFSSSVGGLACMTDEKKIHLFFDKKLADLRINFTQMATDDFDYSYGDFYYYNNPAEDFKVIIHELFHGVEFAYFDFAEDGSEEIVNRNKFAFKSFSDAETHLFDDYLDEDVAAQENSIIDSIDPYGGYALTGPSFDNDRRRGSCGTYKGKHKHKNSEIMASSLNLLNADFIAEDLASFYKTLRENTNFVSPYSAANYLEDFAESMEAYFTGTKYGLDEKITVKDPDDGEVLYTHSPFDIIKNSIEHQNKICPMVNYILKENCNNTL